MWQNTWTTPSTTPTNFTLNLIDFAVGPGSGPYGNICGGNNCGCGITGNINPGICQGYPWLPVLYAKFSGVTVGPSQTVTYYLYLV